MTGFLFAFLGDNRPTDAPCYILLLGVQSLHWCSAGWWIGTHDPIIPEWSANRFLAPKGEWQKNDAEHGELKYREAPNSSESFTRCAEQCAD